MRMINYFGKELTVEQFVKQETCKNAGSRSIAFKEQLQELLTEYPKRKRELKK